MRKKCFPVSKLITHNSKLIYKMFKVSVLSYFGVLFEGQAKSVILPGDEGTFEILDFHLPIISLLAGGDVIVDGEIIPVTKGIMYFYNDELVALVER